MIIDAAHPTLDQLAAFDAGTLPDATRECVERHVADCDSCCRILESLPEDPLTSRVRAFAARGVPDEFHGHPRVEVLELLGAGGMGCVYRAVQRELERPVAVKVLHRRLTERPKVAERFRREMQLLARLNHPNIVQAYGVDRAGDLHFLVMELVDGESLDALVQRRGPLPPAEACELIRQAAIGLQHAHSQGLVHRDVKPSNLLLTSGGVVKVADFGLARAIGPETPATGTAPTILGTPEYMAPEQARDPGSAGIRADLYSLGCSLYFLLAGRPPFVGGSPLQILLDHQDTDPPPIVGLPAAVGAILDRLLAKQPSARFSTPAELADALARVAAPNPTAPRGGRRRAWWPGAVGAGALACATAAVFSLGPRDRPAEPAPTAPAPAPQPLRPHTPELALAPPPRPVDRDALATPEQLAAWRKGAGERLVDWVRTNNRWNEKANIAVSTAGMVNNALPGANGFSLVLGSGLVRSGKPTLIASRTGGFFVFELTPEQARGADALPNRHAFVEYVYSADPRRARPSVRLEDLRIEGADAHAPGGRVEGTVTCEFAGAPARGAYLRLTHHRPDGARVMFLHHPTAPPPAGRSVIRFSANPLEPRTLRAGRLVPVFAEWVSRGGEVESESAAALVLIRER